MGQMGKGGFLWGRGIATEQNRRSVNNSKVYKEDIKGLYY